MAFFQDNLAYYFFFAGTSLRGKEALALLAFAHDVEAEEVCGAGFGAGAGDDGDDLAWLDVAAHFQ